MLFMVTIMVRELLQRPFTGVSFAATAGVHLVTIAVQMDRVVTIFCFRNHI